MNRRLGFLVSIAALLVLLAQPAGTRSFRIAQVPNGATNGCVTCHTGNGGPRNAFGLEIQNGFLSAAGAAGSVLWGPDLAALDSDGDGVPNGDELLDLDFTWVMGDANPSHPFHAVTNPGVVDATPPETGSFLYFVNEDMVGGATIERISLAGGAAEPVVEVADDLAFGVSVDPESQRLFYTTTVLSPNSSTVWRAGPLGDNPEALVVLGGATSSSFVDIDALYGDGQEYLWLDLDNRTIHGRLWEDGENPASPIVSLEIVLPLGAYYYIAVNDLVEEAYVADWTHSTISKVSGLDFSVTVLLDDTSLPELSNPSALAVDSLAGKLYWAQTGANAGIWWANVDGSGAEQLYAGDYGSEQGGLVLDPESSMLYWSNFSFTTGEILKAPMDGTGPVSTFLSFDSGFGAKGLDIVHFDHQGIPDADGDGFDDEADNCPDTANPGQEDFDLDGMGDACDLDDDGDGTPDVDDAFPLDASETLDSDEDGTGNNADLDDDNDGFSDEMEASLGTDALDAASVPSTSDPATFAAFGGYTAYLADPNNSDLFAAGVCDETAAFEHWRDNGFGEGRGFADGQLRTDNPDGSPDPDYGIDGGFSWEYAGANTVVFITADAPKPEGWDGRFLLLERCQTFNIGSHYTAQAYRTINVDVAQAIDGGLIPGFASVTDHYVKYGFKEGRLTNSDWAQAELEAWVDADYFVHNGDVQTYFEGAQSEGWIAFGKIGFAHYINFGRYEGRNDGQLTSLGLAIGPITGFGSIFVNGTEWDTDRAEVVGGDGTLVDQPLGMVATVEGVFSADGTTGVASHVFLESEVEGPISSIVEFGGVPATLKELVVLGVTVVVEDGVTIFDDADPTFSFFTLAVNDVVEVSGLPDENDVLQVTRIEKHGFFNGVDSVEVEVEGMVTSLDDTGTPGSFNVDGIAVNFDTTGVTTDLSELDQEGIVLADGLYVEVEGSWNGSLLVADRIEAEHDYPEDIDKVSLEGIINAYTDLANFEVDGQSVDASGGGVEFSPASAAEMLAVGLKIEVEGPIVEGVLEAEEVKLRGESLRISAEVTAVDTETLTLLGVVVGHDSATRIEDDRDDLEPFAFVDILVGDFVEVKGVDDGNGGLLATQIERTDVGEVELRGPVESYDRAAGTVTVLGVTVPTSTTTDFEGGDGTDVGAGGFFDILDANPGQVIEVKDKAGPATSIDAADEMEIESRDIPNSTLGLGSCSYINPFSQSPECKEYSGSAWTDTAGAEDCLEGPVGSPGTWTPNSTCEVDPTLGNCVVSPDDGLDYVIEIGGSEARDCTASAHACTAFVGGTFLASDNCAGYDQAPMSGDQAEATAFQWPTLSCVPALEGEPEGATNGEVCTWNLISASTEEGRRYVDYGDCDIVHTNRPYYPLDPWQVPPTEDPRYEDATWLAESDWVQSQVRSSACICCHSEDAAPSGPSRWSVDAGPLWVDTMSDEALALFAGHTDSSILGAFDPADNNGFDRVNSAMPTTDVARMLAFFQGELDRRFVTNTYLEGLPDIGGPLLLQRDYVPEACAEGEGVDAAGHLIWNGGEARYLYVLPTDASNPGLPPNLDLPAGTVWRADVLHDVEAFESGVPYGTLPTGALQRHPESGPPDALVSGQQYYLYVLRDVAIPIARCLFEAP